MINNHPIVPSTKLLDEWLMDTELANWRLIAIKAAQWGADQELEACKQWLSLRGYAELAVELGCCMRNTLKPPSLKEQALSELNLTADPAGAELSRTQVELIRRALETL